MCDNMNSVLFTDTECVVLSPDFKLLDENQVLLRVPRKNNMYSVDLKNVAPSGGLTCLFAKATLDESNLWHKRLGHINFKTMNKLVRGNLVRGLSLKIFENDHTCVACQKGKQHKAFCKTKTVSSISQPLQLLHMDLFGLTFVKSIMKKMYCLVVTDNFSRCDNGTEFKNKEMNQFCEMKGIKREFSVARTPQQNGVAERKNRTLIEAARTMLADSKLPTTFWAEAVNTACYVQNRVLVIKPHNKTPYELFNGRPPIISFMRPFGCPVTILNTLDHLGKFDGKADEGFFVGYSVNSKAFRVFNSRTRIVEETLHITFLENKPNVAGSGPEWLFDIDTLTKSMNYKPVVAGNQTNGNAGTKESIDAGQAGKKTIPSHEYILLPLCTQNPTFSSSSKDSPDAGFKPSEEEEKKDAEDPENEDSKVLSTKEPRVNQEKDAENVNNTNNINTVSSTVNTTSIMDNVVDENIVYGCADDPNMPNLEEIVYSNDDADFVTEGDMNNLEQQEFTKIIHLVQQRINHKDFQNCPFACFLSQAEPKKTLVDLRYGKRAIGTKWVYRNKKDERGIVIRNQARLVPQGYTQEEGINYDKVFAPVARIEAIRFFLAYALYKDFVVYQMDVKSAFLYGKIEEEVYVCQPSGFEDPEFPDRVYKLEKVLYGIQQAPRAWYETLSTYLLDNGFQRGIIDKTFFIKKVKGDILLVQVYVDDIIFGSTKKGLCTEFEKLMHKKFQISYMGELTFFLGLTPMETLKPLMKDENAEDVDIHLYRSMIGSLMYLTSSRPDIMFTVCVCERFQVTPKVSHLQAVKRIFRYLKGQPKLGLWYPKDSPFDLEAYTDSDYAGASLDRKSTTRVLFGYIDDWNGVEMLRMKLGLKLVTVRVTTAEAIFNDEYATPSHTKKVFANKRRQGKDFLGIVTPLFATMLIQPQADVGEGSGQPSEPQHTPTTASPSNIEPIPTVASSSHLKKTHKHRKTKRKATEISQFSGPTILVADETVHEEMGDSMERAATTTASLDAEQDIGNINRTQSMETLNEPIPQGTGSGSGPRRQDTILGDRPAQTRFERLSKQSNDPPLSRVNTIGSGEDSMKLNELMEICTKLSERILALENIKTAQDLEIINLKKRVKKLEKKKKARTPQLKRRLFKVRIECSADKSLSDQEDASKQERNIAELDQDEGISFDQDDVETQGRYDHAIEINTASTSISTASINVTTTEPIITTSAPITSAGVSVSTTEPSTPPTTTTLIEDEDLIIAQTLVKIRKPSESGTRKTVPPPQHDPKDKGKAKMIELENPSKKKDQINFDEEMAKRLAEELEAELEEEERDARQREEEANLISWDNTQAMMEADYELAQRLQAEEQRELTIEERSKLFVELMDKRKKHFAKLRAEEIRRKPPTKT
ncbi:putative ribonuclease H-like domain-containing protein [Tanacetum coccineum]